MTKLEERYPCPVCLGVKMNKMQLPDSQWVMDYCPRCGGIWFDRGEVQQLRSYKPQALWSRVTPNREMFRMSCHDCHGLMDRNAPACPVCGWKNIIDCPTCGQTMKAVTYQNLKLDVCKHCQGIWFDQIELSEIWNLKLDEMARKRRTGIGRELAGDGVDIFLSALFWSPDLVWGGAEMLGRAGAGMLEGAKEVGTNLPDFGGAVEATGELAGSVFETIAEIIGNIFSDWF